MKKLFISILMFFAMAAAIPVHAMNADQAKCCDAREAARQGLDLYAIIGVSEKASQATLQKAARSNARKVHTDKGGTQDNIALFNRAATILKDTVSRQAYDRARATLRENRSGWRQRSKAFYETLRAYKRSVVATTAVATGAAVVSTSYVINCADVAQAVCNGQVVSQTALDVCKAHIPGALSCWLGYF